MFSEDQSVPHRFFQKIARAAICLSCAVSLVATTHGQDATEPSAASALDSIFNVRTAPDAKSMGIFQGTFLDAIRSESSMTQIAFVVDSTESMATQLEGIRKKIPQVVEDVKRATGGKVEVAVVIYADSGDANKPVIGIEKGFQSADEKLPKLLDHVTPQSGRPYFPEAVDFAVYKTLNELPWSKDPKVTRWLMLIGDAPPYDASFDEPKTQSRRWYDTDAIVNLANQHGVQIHCLLCESREAERKAFETVAEKTRNFMGQLSSRTGGLMLDLSFSKIRDKVAQASRRPRADFAYVGAIKDSDIESLKNSTSDNIGELASLRIAVMPHLPWEDMSFYHEIPGVQFSSTLRYSLKRLPGLSVVPSRTVESEFLRIKSGPVPKDQWPQALCLRLRADLLIVGTMRQSGDISDVQSQIYSPKSAKPIASIAASGTRDVLLASYLRSIQQSSGNQGPMVLLAKAVSSEQATDLREFWPGILGKLSPDQHSNLISGIELIEKSLNVSLEPDARVQDLENATQLLQPLAGGTSPNALALSLLGSAHFNLAKTKEEQGNLAAGKEDMGKAIAYLKKAFEQRRNLKDRLLQAEIEADHALFVRNDFPSAVRRYQEITKYSEASLLHMALRSHWMLAGIQLGDWGSAKSSDFQPNTAAAREHLIHILAYWPESEEARIIQKYMRWDESEGKTNAPFFPKEGDLLLTAN